MSSKKKQGSVNAEKIKNIATTRPIEKKTAPDFFENLGKRAVLLTAGLILLIGFIVFKNYLLFENIFLFKDIGSDTYNVFYPYLYGTAEYIEKYGLPKWSFSAGMGKNMFPFFLNDPFNIFLYLAGKNHVIYGLAYKELAKILLSGLTFFYYLRTLKFSNYTSVTGSLLFAFSGFIILGGTWYVFSYEAFNFAFLLLAFELLLLKKNWYLFPIAIFLICISNPFNLYVIGLFFIFYVILRLIQTDSLNVNDAGGLFLKMAGLSLLGILLSGPFFLENLVQMLESPRGSGQYAYTNSLSSNPVFAFTDMTQLGTCMLRFFSSDILGSGSDFKGWSNLLEAPLFYCGLPCLIIMPQVFQFLDARLKKAFAVFLALWLFPIIFPYFRHAFWLFTGDYYRVYSLFVAFIFVYYTLMAFEHIIKEHKINLPVLIGTLVGLFILLYYPYFPDKDYVNSQISVFVSFMLIVYAVLIFLISKTQNNIYLRFAFLAALVFELFFLSGFSVNERNVPATTELSQKTAYNDYTTDAVKFIKDHDHSFYRIDKSYASSPAIHYSLNDALVQGYYGSSSYNSFNQVDYIHYLVMMGVIDKTNETESRWASGLISRPLLQAENSVKYILAKGREMPLWHYVCDSLAKFGDVTVLRNKYSLPLGYTYNSFIKESVYSKFPNDQKDFTSLKACVIKDADITKVQRLREYNIRDTVSASAFTPELFAQDVSMLKKDTLAMGHFEDSKISGKIDVDEPKMLYLSIPCDKGWKLKVDGTETPNIMLSAGMTGVMLNKGSHTIELTYQLRGWNNGLMMVLAGFILYVILLLATRKNPEAAVSKE